MSAPSTPSEADVIAAEFPTITLLDGSELVLRASLANTRIVEDRYGSLGGLFDAFNSIADQGGESAEEYMKRKLFTPLIDIMACFMPRGPLRDPEELAEHLDGRHFEGYLTALGQTITLAFPAAKAGEAPQDGPGNAPSGPQAVPTPGTVDFPGVPSGTAPPSSSAAPTTSSGG